MDEDADDKNTRRLENGGKKPKKTKKAVTDSQVTDVFEDHLDSARENQDGKTDVKSDLHSTVVTPAKDNRRKKSTSRKQLKL